MPYSIGYLYVRGRSAAVPLRESSASTPKASGTQVVLKRQSSADRSPELHRDRQEEQDRMAAQNALSHERGGSMLTASGLPFRGDRDGNFLVIDATIGEVSWKFQTRFGADAPATVFQVDGNESIAIATGEDSIQGSVASAAVWASRLKGRLGPLRPPQPAATVAGPTGAVAEG